MNRADWRDRHAKGKILFDSTPTPQARRFFRFSVCLHRIFREFSRFIGPWLSLVERLVRDEEAAGSNPAGPTIS